MGTYQPRRPLDESTPEYPTDLQGMRGRPPPSVNAPMERVGTGGAQVFVPPADGKIVPNELPEGMTFDRQALNRQTPPPILPAGSPSPPIQGPYPHGALPEGMTFTPFNRHLDTIDAVTKRVDKLGGRPPLEVLGLDESQLDTPAKAASAAQWAQAYERVVQTGGGPRALGALNLATKNLRNNIQLAGDVLDATNMFKNMQRVNQLERDLRGSLGINNPFIKDQPAPVVPILPYQLSRPPGD